MFLRVLSDWMLGPFCLGIIFFGLSILIAMSIYCSCLAIKSLFVAIKSRFQAKKTCGNKV